MTQSNSNSDGNQNAWTIIPEIYVDFISRLVPGAMLWASILIVYRYEFCNKYNQVAFWGFLANKELFSSATSISIIIILTVFIFFSYVFGFLLNALGTFLGMKISKLSIKKNLQTVDKLDISRRPLGIKWVAESAMLRSLFLICALFSIFWLTFPIFQKINDIYDLKYLSRFLCFFVPSIILYFLFDNLQVFIEERLNNVASDPKDCGKPSPKDI